MTSPHGKGVQEPEHLSARPSVLPSVSHAISNERGDGASSTAHSSNNFIPSKQEFASSGSGPIPECLRSADKSLSVRYEKKNEDVIAII